MPRPRFDKLPPGRREHLLEVAAHEFAAHGYEGASLNRIIQFMGLSKGSFYYYFDDKADLFAAVVELAWRALLPAAAPAPRELDAASFWPRLEGLLREVRGRIYVNPWLVGLGRLFYAPPADARVAALLAARFEQARAWQLAMLRRGQEVGAVRDDLPLGLLLAVLVGADEAADRWLVANWEELGNDDAERLADTVFAVLRRMLEPPPVRVTS